LADVRRARAGRFAALATLLALTGCYAPGVGPRAHGFYSVSPPVMLALSAYYADHDRYPKTLDELVPRYLPRVPTQWDAGTRTLIGWSSLRKSPAFKYERLLARGYVLRFEYAGPGFNVCTYSPTEPSKWDCGGYY
jgi:hypothetical protein